MLVSPQPACTGGLALGGLLPAVRRWLSLFHVTTAATADDDAVRLPQCRQAPFWFTMAPKRSSHFQPAAATTADDASEMYMSGWRLGTVILSLFFASFLIALDTNIINTAVPQITSDFHALSDGAWYGAAYLVTLTVFQPLYGSFYKYFDKVNVYRTAIVVFESEPPSVPGPDGDPY